MAGASEIFCSSADLETGTGFATLSETSRTHMDRRGRVALLIHRRTKPVIAAINRSAVVIGISMTLQMARIVSSESRLGLVFARRGIVVEAITGYLLPRLIGKRRATCLATTGAVYPATDPLWRKLSSKILPREKILLRAIELAYDMTKNTSNISTSLFRDLM
jgi:enoyl-CoA hydratase/carnithine racemase